MRLLISSVFSAQQFWHSDCPMFLQFYNINLLFSRFIEKQMNKQKWIPFGRHKNNLLSIDNQLSDGRIPVLTHLHLSNSYNQSLTYISKILKNCTQEQINIIDEIQPPQKTDNQQITSIQVCNVGVIQNSKKIDEIQMFVLVRSLFYQFSKMTIPQCLSRLTQGIYFFAVNLHKLVYYQTDFTQGQIARFVDSYHCYSESLIIHYLGLYMQHLLDNSLSRYMQNIRSLQMEMMKIVDLKDSPGLMECMRELRNMGCYNVRSENRKIQNLTLFMEKLKFNIEQPINFNIAIYLIDIQLQKLKCVTTTRYHSSQLFSNNTIPLKKPSQKLKQTKKQELQHPTKQKSMHSQLKPEKAQQRQNQRLKHSNSMGDLTRFSRQNNKNKTSKHHNNKNRTYKKYNILNSKTQLWNKSKHDYTLTNENMWKTTNTNFVKSNNGQTKHKGDSSNWYYYDNKMDNINDTFKTVMKNGFLKKCDAPRKQADTDAIDRIKQSKKQCASNFNLVLTESDSTPVNNKTDKRLSQDSIISKMNIIKNIHSLAINPQTIVLEINETKNNKQLRISPCVFNLGITSEISLPKFPVNIKKSNININQKEKPQQIDQLQDTNQSKNKNINQNRGSISKNQEKRQQPNCRSNYANYLGSLVAFVRVNLPSQKARWIFPSFVVYLHYALIRLKSLNTLHRSQQMIDSSQKIKKSLESMQSYILKNKKHPQIVQYLKIGGEPLLEFNYEHILISQSDKASTALKAINQDSTKILTIHLNWLKQHLYKNKSQLINKETIKPYLKYCLMLHFGFLIIRNQETSIPEIEETQLRSKSIEDNSNMMMFDIRQWVSSLGYMIQKYSI